MGDDYSFEKNTATGRKRSYAHIPGFEAHGFRKPEQLELKLGFPPLVAPEDLVLARSAERYFFVSRHAYSGKSPQA